MAMARMVYGMASQMDLKMWALNELQSITSSVWGEL